MIFKYVLGIQNINNENTNIIRREAVRAIILKGNKILMVHTNKGDYKFPGGGVKKEENYEESLIREVREETGYIVNNVKEKMGVIIERKIDEYEKHSIFEMISNYYLCEISDKKTVQQLDDYEFKLDFQPVWIPLDKAIHFNEEILKMGNKKMNAWVKRDTNVLKELKEYYNMYN